MKRLRQLLDGMIERFFDERAVCDLCGFDELVAVPGLQSVVCGDCLSLMREFGVLVD